MNGHVVMSWLGGTVAAAAIGLVLVGCAADAGQGEDVGQNDESALKGGKHRDAGTPTASATCASLNGVTLVGSTVQKTGVYLTGGQRLTAKVSPANANQFIFLSASLGLNLFFEEGPTTGYTFTAPGTGLWNLTFNVESSDGAADPSSYTWTFSCQ